MQTVVVLAAFVAIAIAAPAADPSSSKPIGVLYRDENQDAFGQFSSKIETENGILLTREGTLKATGTEGEYVLVQSGSESWTSPEGLKFLLTWYADEDGYHAKGDHLPVGPTVAPPAA